MEEEDYEDDVRDEFMDSAEEIGVEPLTDEDDSYEEEA
jgi:hypothetical protein